MKLAFRQVTIAVAVAVAAAGATVAAQKVQITGAGATFPYPIYSKWFSEYNKLHPNVEINYQSIGSGGGVKQLSSRTVFFGASDYPLTPEQLLAAPGKILHFPTVLGAVVPIYNVPGVSAELKFTGPLLADIFMGTITKWNDSRIAKLNEGVTLPNSDITVVHRSDGSGTTYIFVDFLSKVSPEWKKRVGVAGSVNWPVGVGAKGNEAVAGMVKQTPGSLGYTEPAYATENKIAFGTVQNVAGKFIKASAESVTAAAAGAVKQMPADFRVSMTNPPGDDSYPIASFTWLLMYQVPQDKALAKTMVDFTKWALSDGQKYAAELGYAPLPKAVIDLELKSLSTIKTQ
jgi:phosphate transport system substrate-binding protein